MKPYSPLIADHPQSHFRSIAQWTGGSADKGEVVVKWPCPQTL
jgi:hypothetical protein